MKFPKLAIVGRPNVGKSALFNRLCKKRISIVDEAEGVTRDRLYARADFFGRPYEVIDTGGIDPVSAAAFQEAVRRQAEIAIEEADALIFVVDGKLGVTSLDEQVAQILHRKNKPVTLAINKVDNIEQKTWVDAFYSLGFSFMEPISALHGLGVAEMLEKAFREAKWDEEIEEEERIHIAIVGRPNVGKSTLINSLLHEERCIVSPIAGTTRDSIDMDIEVEGEKYRFIDTAGIRRKRAEGETVDKFAAIRTQRAIERADICLLVLDAKEGMTVQEKRIAKDIEALGKGCILLFNKWDLVKGFRMEHCVKAVREDMHFLQHCPTLFVSAKSGKNLENIYAQIHTVVRQASHRISTGELNRFLEKAIQKYHPPALQGKRLRIYYVAQVGIKPPHFILFVNKSSLMVDSYKKYLINMFRKSFSFTGVPLYFSLKTKKDRIRNC